MAHRHPLDLPRRLPSSTRRQALKALGGAALAGAMGSRARPGGARPVAGARQAMPETVRAIYLNTLIFYDRSEIARLVDLIRRTELNALVVDIKEHQIFYRSNVPFFRDLGVVAPLVDISDLLDTLRTHGVYAIARLVVFKDPHVAEARPDLAVRDRTTGGLWRDMNGVAWVNPCAEELWEANADLAREAARLGFAEVQFDYVRFPTDGDLATMDFGRPFTYATRTAAIAGFLARAREKLARTETRISADVFGYTLLVEDDLGIGQDVGMIAPLVDAVCPMVYPSHFPEGSIAVPGHPNDHPYETIAISMDRGKARLPGLAHRLRPWLQDFSLPGMTEYGVAEVRAQIDAAEAAGVGGWMVWDANNVYHAEAFGPAE